MVPVAVEVVEHDRFRTVPAAGALPAMHPDSPAQVAAVPPDLLGDRLQQGGAGCGSQGLVRRPAAQFVVAQAQQVAQFSEGRLAALQALRHGR